MAQLPEPVSALASQMFRYSGPTSGVTAGKAAETAVENMEFTRAWRLETVSLPENPEASVEWSMQFKATAAMAVRKDDTVLARFWMRCVEAPGGECANRFVVERNSNPYTKSYSTVQLSGSEWRQVKVAFRMAEDLGPQQWTAGFWMGQQVQTVEIAAIEVLVYGQGVRFEDLGIDPMYEGASGEAAWRTEAFDRIERIRKAPVRLTVEDANGQPVAGATVRLTMKSHEFNWGTAVAAQQLLGVSDDSDRYRDFILANFNMVVLENDLKWPQWEQNRQRALDALSWLEEHGIARVRGHNLIWPGWQWLPKDLPTLQSDPAGLRERIRAHIEDTVSGTRGRLVDWDVLNEPYSNRDLQKILGDEAMAEWFREARKHDDRPRLYINDYNILSAGGTDLAHRNHYAKTIRFLLDQGAPVEAIGMQGHFGGPTPPELMLRILDRFAEFQLPIAITEYDFNTKDEEMQARFFRDLLITVFSHPSVESFLMWGFWEGRHWLPDGAMIRRDWTEKASFQVWRDLVYRQWWTRAELTTDEAGACSATGFKGMYEVEAEFEGRKARSEVRVTGEGSELRLQLPPPPEDEPEQDPAR